MVVKLDIRGIKRLLDNANLLLFLPLVSMKFFRNFCDSVEKVCDGAQSKIFSTIFYSS